MGVISFLGRLFDGAGVALVGLAFLGVGLSFAQEPAPGLATGRASGRAIYEKRCAHCHGIEGRGDGPAADFFRPRPANFARAKYKYASTQKGELPTDADLLRTVSEGLPGTGMPAWKTTLGEADRKAVVAYIKSLSNKFAKMQTLPPAIDFGKKIPPSNESIAKGKELFLKVECNRCHGMAGRADGPNAKELAVWPRNLTKGWTFRRGNSPEEIFQRISRGIIVMPSFAKGENVETTEEERWHIANYVHSLSLYKGNPEVKETIVAKKVARVTEDPDDPIWEEANRYFFPLVGQVTIEPRQFTPTIDSLLVKALYDDNAFALLLTWDDPTQSLLAEGAEGDDAVAVQFPLSIREGEKPYFLMGSPDYPVYLARWNAAGAAIEEFNATGQEDAVGIRFQPQESNGQQFRGKGIYQEGQYRAVFTRTLKTPDKNDLQVTPEQFIPIAFSAWDGSNGDRDSKRSISAWYYLLLKPPDPPTRYIYPTLFAGIILGIEWWLSRRYQNKRGGKTPLP